MSDGAQRDGAQRDGATAPRYARLRGDWLPRGWSDAPTTLVNWRHGRVRQLGRDSFYAVRACDGRTNLNSPALLPGHRRLLDRYLAEGIAEPCPAGTPLDPGQEYRRFDHPMIWGVHWAVTGRCNLNCRYCFMQAPSGRYGHPSSAEVSQLLDQFERAGVFQVSLTGGEP
ncbi:MAG: radical SAM protein, partial [Micromonosporaceae bacterium]|nr:radical SAM protein [Micromonosporaceae bacterium]